MNFQRDTCTNSYKNKKKTSEIFPAEGTLIGIAKTMFKEIAKNYSNGNFVDI